jgi:hypothetical protein
MPSAKEAIKAGRFSVFAAKGPSTEADPTGPTARDCLVSVLVGLEIGIRDRKTKDRSGMAPAEAQSGQDKPSYELSNPEQVYPECRDAVASASDPWLVFVRDGVDRAGAERGYGCGNWIKNRHV